MRVLVLVAMLFGAAIGGAKAEGDWSLTIYEAGNQTFIGPYDSKDACLSARHEKTDALKADADKIWTRIRPWGDDPNAFDHYLSVKGTENNWERNSICERRG